MMRPSHPPFEDMTALEIEEWMDIQKNAALAWTSRGGEMSDGYHHMMELATMHLEGMDS